VKIREKLGDAYSPEAGSAPSETYLNYGLLYTSLTIDPDKAAKINETVSALADELAKNGVTPDELARAKNPVLTLLRESARTNGYWLSAVLANAQEYPQRLDWCRSRYADNEAITKADLDVLAKQYLGSKRAFRVIVHPEKK
jgi:zinc protease